MMSRLSDTQSLVKWEDRRAIKNLMGKYTSACLIKKELEIFDTFWSGGSEDVCLGFNDGYYVGTNAVKGYYQAVHQNTQKKAEIIKNVFADKLTDKEAEDMYGAGPFDNRPVSTPLIEIAGDGKTAKGIWQSTGSYADITASGPVSFWTWGFYTVDFIKENGFWKIWHLSYVNDVDTMCGQTWTRANIPFPEAPAFSDASECILPEYCVTVPVRERYHEKRPFTKTPRLPEPYEMFADTFSYGI